MPYKDPQKKLEGEELHRPERLARRRELREIDAAWKAAHPGVSLTKSDAAFVLFPLAARGTLASYDPKLAIGGGALTLNVAYAYKKDWR